jgi:hypothetical protein
MLPFCIVLERIYRLRERAASFFGSPAILKIRILSEKKSMRDGHFAENLSAQKLALVEFFSIL